MRELLCALTGNELVLGVVLGNWLLLMGAGAWLARLAHRPQRRLVTFLWLQILIAVVPVAQVLAVRGLRNQVFPRGAAVGLGATFAASLVVLLPYCLAAGFMLALACLIHAQAANKANAYPNACQLANAQPGSAAERIDAQQDDETQTGAGPVYIADSLGSILGGALYSLVLAWVFNCFVLLACIGLLVLALAAWQAWLWGQKWMAPVAVAGAAYLVVAAFMLPTDAATIQWQHPGQEVLFRGNSPYGQIVVTRAGNQINFFQNGLPVVSTQNTAQVEEAAHYAMAQRPNSRAVLLVGGGVAGTALELLKYRAQVTCVELDPLFVELGGRFVPQNLADPRIRVVNTDGRRFVQTSRSCFEVLIIDLADPTTALLNRFHTAEFLAQAKGALTTNGVLELAVGRYQNFVSADLRRVLATAHKTLQGAFTNVLMLPGERVFFLASDGPLSLAIAQRLEQAHIPTRLVNRHYLEATLTPDRLADLQRAVAGPGQVNHDFSPALYFHCVRLWASQFNPRFGVVEALLVLALGLYIVRLRGAAVTLFASGFAASSLEVVLLLAFQALCGSLYYQLGIIVTVFMAGLAAGAAASRRLPASRAKGLAALAVGIAALSVLLLALLNLLSRLRVLDGSSLPVQTAIAVLTFALAGMVGGQFPLANQIVFNGVQPSASRLYTADFMGAFLGALLASALLIPLLGVRGVCLLAAALNTLAAGALVWRKESR